MNAPKWLLPALALTLTGLACQTVTRLISPTTAVDPTLAAEATTGVDATSMPELPDIATAEPSASAEYAVPDEGRYHIDLGATADYKHFPPSSGLHYGKILNWGFYNEPIPPEYWVHSLEHGGVVILYNCATTCKDTEDAIWKVVQNAPAEDQFNEVKILVTPNDKIDHPIIALAWDTELDLEQVDYAVLMDFYNRHVNKGPEDAP
jgi:Protein of unknown function (DUF3105)